MTLGLFGRRLRISGRAGLAKDEDETRVQGVSAIFHGSGVTPARAGRFSIDDGGPTLIVRIDAIRVKDTPAEGAAKAFDARDLQIGGGVFIKGRAISAVGRLCRLALDTGGGAIGVSVCTASEHGVDAAFGGNGGRRLSAGFSTLHGTEAWLKRRPSADDRRDGAEGPADGASTNASCLYADQAALVCWDGRAGLRSRQSARAARNKANERVTLGLALRAALTPAIFIGTEGRDGLVRRGYGSSREEGHARLRDRTGVA